MEPAAPAGQRTSPQSVPDNRGGIKMKSERTIKRRLKELRAQIDSTKDPAVERISYAMECGIRWAREETVGWEPPAETARELAVLLRRELNV